MLATSGNYSQAKISRVLVERLSVEPKRGERITLPLGSNQQAVLTVHLSSTITESLELNLVRYEFLSRVATEGALPASFSKECYEDMLAFKSRLLAAHERRRLDEGIEEESQLLGLKLLNVTKEGTAEDRFVEVKL